MTAADRPPERGEFEWIAALRARVGVAERSVIVGIGDDAAVLAPRPGREQVVTTDLLVEGIHFVLGPDGAQPSDVGWKALAVSISDVAAMGASSRYAVVSAGLPVAAPRSFADGLLDGLLACAREYGVSIVGGDTTAAPRSAVVNVALIGDVEPGQAIRRSGARPGDAICVTGALGGSLLGRHLHPIPRQAEALLLVQENDVHAMIDVSDGLSSDLGHVLDASGVGAVVDPRRVPIHEDAGRAAAGDGRSALEHALHDGEDFELCFTIAPDAGTRLQRAGLGGTPVACIGTITEEPGLVLEDDAGRRSLPRRGYDHFRAD